MAFHSPSAYCPTVCFMLSSVQEKALLYGQRVIAIISEATAELSVVYHFVTWIDFTHSCAPAELLLQKESPHPPPPPKEAWSLPPACEAPPSLENQSGLLLSHSGTFKLSPAQRIGSPRARGQTRSHNLTKGQGGRKRTGKEGEGRPEIPVRTLIPNPPGWRTILTNSVRELG